MFNSQKEQIELLMSNARLKKVDTVDKQMNKQFVSNLDSYVSDIASCNLDFLKQRGRKVMLKQVS